MMTPSTSSSVGSVLEPLPIIALILFFYSITTPNFLLMYFCQILQAPIFIGRASILLLLLCFCFCLGNVVLVSRPALICCGFCCLIIFFCTIPAAYLLLLCLRTINRCSIFIILVSFEGLLVPDCFCQVVCIIYAALGLCFVYLFLVLPIF